MFKMSFTQALIALTLVAILAVCAEFALAGTLEYQEKLVDGHLQPTLDISANKALSDHFGWSAFFLSCEGWSEGYVGPTVAPVSWLQAGVSMGVESDPQVTRVASFVWVGKGPASFIYINEQGGSGPWTKSVAKMTVVGDGSAKFVLGAHYQSGYGIGPRVETALKPITVWMTLFPKQDATTAILGIQLGF